MAPATVSFADVPERANRGLREDSQLLPREHSSGVRGQRIAVKHVAFGPGSSAG
jgi:hypothetical protein